MEVRGQSITQLPNSSTLDQISYHLITRKPDTIRKRPLEVERDLRQSGRRSRSIIDGKLIFCRQSFLYYLLIITVLQLGTSCVRKIVVPSGYNMSSFIINTSKDRVISERKFIGL